MIFWTCVRKVLREMDNRAQASGMVSPSASARRTSSSRLVRGTIVGHSAPRSRADATRCAMPHDHGPWQERFSGCGIAHGRDDVLHGAILGHVAVRTRLDRFEDRLVVGDRSEHDDARGRPARLDGSGSVRSGAVGESVVHEHHVRSVPGHGPGRRDRARDADDFDVGLCGQQARQRIGQKLVVVDEEDSDPFALGWHAVATP